MKFFNPRAKGRNLLFFKYVSHCTIFQIAVSSVELGQVECFDDWLGQAFDGCRFQSN